jgi:amino-acid N-acetyltransferase
MIRTIPVDDTARAFLRAAGLPVDDLVAPVAVQLFGAFDGDALVGVVGLEDGGDAALLRSLAVVDARRGAGYGSALVAFAEDEAATQGVRCLYLLTTTAAEFFDRLGYRRIARDDVPPAMAATPQFATLCPASSTCMSRSLR